MLRSDFLPPKICGIRLFINLMYPVINSLNENEKRYPQLEDGW